MTLEWDYADYSAASKCGRFKVSKSRVDNEYRYLCWQRNGKGWDMMDLPHQTSFKSAEAAICGTTNTAGRRHERTA